MLQEPPGDTTPDTAGGDAGPSVTGLLRAALAPLAPRIDAAFIYGPAATGAATGRGDIDLMIIGNGIEYAEAIALLIRTAKHIGRAIHPSVYSADEWTRKVADRNRVALAVMKQRKVFLIGTEARIPQPR